MKVPTALFYRDAVWKFADWWSVKGIKRFLLMMMHRFDLMIFKRCCDIVYFPSQSMSELFSFKTRKVLPPAGEDNLPTTEEVSVKKTAIYVGGVSERYGTHILLKAFQIVNEEYSVDLKLKLVCRVEQSDPLVAPYKDKPWLQTFKASGDSLQEIYQTADFGVIPFKKDIYMDFAVPVKMMEYLSYSLPIVATDCVETARFIMSNDIGVICEDNADALAEALMKILDQNEDFLRYKKNCRTVLLQSNLWAHRAADVVQDLEALNSQ
jgi:glycosyltransferase involved in cell wall biosynthesis